MDWAVFADKWRGGYGPSMGRVRRGELPWTRIDDLHRMILDDLLVEFGIDGCLDEEEKRHWNKAWHRLTPWADSVEGLTRLKSGYVIDTRCLTATSCAAHQHGQVLGGLPWDCILSAELMKHYKPDPGELPGSGLPAGTQNRER